MIDFIQEHTTLQFWVLFLMLTWAFHYIYKSSNRFANMRYAENDEIHMIFPDIFFFLFSLVIILEGFPQYKKISFLVSGDDFFKTFIVPFPLYFIALYPITKSIIKFIKESPEFNNKK